MKKISGRKTIEKIVCDHSIHPNQVNKRKKQLQDGASELFARGKKNKDKEGDRQGRELAELLQKITKLKIV